MIGKHATTIREEEEGYIVVRYHYTDIVKFNEREIILYSGGFETATTKRRMNQVSKTFNLGYKVYQRNWKWFVSYKGLDWPYYDGITLMREEI